jgi:histone H3/H4
MPPHTAKSKLKNLRDSRFHIGKNVKDIFKSSCKYRFSKNTAQLISDIVVLPLERDRVTVAISLAQRDGRLTVQCKDYDLACRVINGQADMPPVQQGRQKVKKVINKQ